MKETGLVVPAVFAATCSDAGMETRHLFLRRRFAFLAWLADCCFTAQRDTGSAIRASRITTLLMRFTLYGLCFR